MIATVINDPQLKRTIIIVIIEPDNLIRMGRGDPATLESKNQGGILANIDYPQNYAVLVAYELDEVELYKKVRGNAGEFLRYLERGRQFIKGLDGKENCFTITPGVKESPEQTEKSS